MLVAEAVLLLQAVFSENTRLGEPLVKVSALQLCRCCPQVCKNRFFRAETPSVPVSESLTIFLLL